MLTGAKKGQPKPWAGAFSACPDSRRRSFSQTCSMWPRHCATGVQAYLACGRSVCRRDGGASWENLPSREGSTRPHDLSQKWKGKSDFKDWIDLVSLVVHILKSGQEQEMGREVGGKVAGD